MGGEADSPFLTERKAKGVLCLLCSHSVLCNQSFCVVICGVAMSCQELTQVSELKFSKNRPKFFAQKNQLKAKNKEPDFFITGKRNNMQRHIKVK